MNRLELRSEAQEGRPEKPLRHRAILREPPFHPYPFRDAALKNLRPHTAWLTARSATRQR